MEISHPLTSPATLQTTLLVKNFDKKCKALVTCFVRWWRNQAALGGGNSTSPCVKGWKTKCEAAVLFL